MTWQKSVEERFDDGEERSVGHVLQDEVDELVRLKVPQ